MLAGLLEIFCRKHRLNMKISHAPLHGTVSMDKRRFKEVVHQTPKGTSADLKRGRLDDPLRSSVVPLSI